jgi:hypothetical protein
MGLEVSRSVRLALRANVGMVEDERTRTFGAADLCAFKSAAHVATDGADALAVPAARAPALDLLGSLFEHPFGCVVDYDRRFEVVHLWSTPEERLDCLLEGGTVRFLSSLDIFPKIDATALARAFVV